MNIIKFIKGCFINIKTVKFPFVNIKKEPYYRESSDFINSANLYSKTNYLIWVDTKNFKTNIYKGSTNNWTLIKSYSCSIGKIDTPTPKGTFKVGAKGYSFGESKGYVCYYYTQFIGNYLFHSVIYNLDGTVKDARLGMEISNGCVRLAKMNAKWIYDKIPYGTTVFIN